MSNSPRIFALIVAAGKGVRAGEGVAKQYRRVAGKPIMRYSCEALLRHAGVAGVQVVIHPEHAELYQAATVGLGLLPPVIGGLQRSDSVAAGLQALSAHRPDYVLIHDAARPFLSQAMIDTLIATLTPGQAVLPALPMADTVRRFADGAWVEVPRDGLLRMQTPQAFPFARLREIVTRGSGLGAREGSEVVSGSVTSYPSPEPRAPSPEPPTDEAAIWLAAGGALGYVMGDEDLRKVTTAADIDWAQRAMGGRGRTAVGMGFDVHALMPSGEKGVIRLGGIDIEHRHKLSGHSDADVVLHAIVDALLGAVGAGDIGSHFPPTDERWAGADSALFVAEALAQVVQRGGSIEHLDITLICEAPKVSPHREAMRENIAALLHLPLNRVSVKATTTEKLGFTGREEGIAAQAVATIRLTEDA